MTEKDVLLLIIKEGKACADNHDITGYHCDICPFAEDDYICGSRFIHDRDTKRKRIINYYVEKYGRDTDLIEVLI